MSRHLFVVAHPDDEVLGAGAFIYDAAKRGDVIGVAVLNTCDTTRYEENPEAIKDDLDRTHELLGVTKTYKFNYNDSNFHNADHRKMVQDIERVIRVFEPDNIFTQHPCDINSDHYWTFQSCMEAFRLWQRGNEEIHPISGLYLMEVQSSTDWGVNPALKVFQPNTFIQVSPEGVQAKINALALYENVIRLTPHPRAVVPLMMLPVMRGTQGGFEKAEAFECVFRRGETI